MPFSNEDKALTQLSEDTDRILENKLQKEGLDTLLKSLGKQEAPRTVHRLESSRLKHARTKGNVTTIDELVGQLNQEGQKQAHRSTRQISKKTGLTQCSIVQIIQHRDLGLKCL